MRDIAPHGTALPKYRNRGATANQYQQTIRASALGARLLSGPCVPLPSIHRRRGGMEIPARGKHRRPTPLTEDRCLLEPVRRSSATWLWPLGWHQKNRPEQTEH
jgi:hypothetical protein